MSSILSSNDANSLDDYSNLPNRAQSMVQDILKEGRVDKLVTKQSILSECPQPADFQELPLRDLTDPVINKLQYDFYQIIKVRYIGAWKKNTL